MVVIGGLLPLGFSIFAIWRGMVGRKAAHIARDIVALARTMPVFGSRDVAQHLGLRPIDAERAVLNAIAYGFVEEDPEATLALEQALRSSSGALVITQPAANAALGPSGPAFPRDFAAATTQHAPMSPRPISPSEPPMSGNLVGTLLHGTYQIDALLGSGGMGAVYEARHLRTKRRYAIKTLLPDAQFSPDAIRRFEREATSASALGHPGIVAVHDFNVTEGGLYYLVMDLLVGETLEERLAQKGSLPWAEARRVVVEAGFALAAAHEAGVLHRDLKPANIFLARTADGLQKVVLVDFGLAKPIGDEKVSRLTSTGAAVGTPLYMAPEQARGEAVDVRADVYGLAAVLYEMLTGTPPFFDRTLAAVYARLLTESAPSAVAAARHPIPKVVDDLLSCGLAKAPNERFDSVRAFVSAITNVGDG